MGAKMKLLLAIAGLLAVAHGLNVKLTDNQCDGTMCPAGCCPNVGWYCCPGNMYCAATAADCPFVAKKTQLMKMAKSQRVMAPCAPPAAAPTLAGTAAPTTCTVLPLPLTARLWPRRPADEDGQVPAV